MMNDTITRHLSDLPLHRLGDDRSAGLWIVSLPLPRDARQDWSLAGRPTHVKPLGKWGYGQGTGPRRLLLAADAAGQAPASIKLAAGSPRAATAPPAAEMEVFAHAYAKDLGILYWERHFLKIAWGGRWVGLAMGMRVGGQVHWWEYCNLVTLGESLTCREIEMGGVIPYQLTTAEQMKTYRGKDNPFIHRHNWLNGHIYARLHCNGVCEVYAHHINAQFGDDGMDLKDAVPVIGIRAVPGDNDEAIRALCGAWDGSRTSLRVGPASFDLTDAARLATPQQPGRLDAADGFLVWQPYLGCEIYGGETTRQRTGDPYICHAEQQLIPRGMARTLRFSLSLNDQRPPRVARYLAPNWWYGLCEEYLPQPLLPVSKEFDATIDRARQGFRTYMIPAGFEEGENAGDYHGDPKQRRDPATEGDVAGALFLIAYRTGDVADYDAALRSSFNFTDVWVDHVVKKVRYQGYTPPAAALPLQRVLSCLFAYLETGDAYCEQTARAVIENAYWWHKNSWPRMAMGRDACFVHSAVWLWRFLGEGRYLEIARDAIRDVGSAQWPDGSFGDQGGGAGIHGQAAYTIKPWMGWMATMGAMDYLEHFPDDEEVLGIVRRFVEFLMRERAPRDINPGDPSRTAIGWTYQHPFRGKRLPGVEVPPSLTRHLFHFDYTARLLPYFSFRDGDPRYFEAFLDSFEGCSERMLSGYGSCAATFTFLPWLQARLWNAEVTDQGVRVRPAGLGPRTPASATIFTPAGPVEVQWKEGKVSAPKGVEVG